MQHHGLYAAANLPAMAILFLLDVYGRRRWRLILAEWSYKFCYCSSFLFFYFINATDYRSGRYEPSSLSTKGLHTFTLFKFPLTLSLCVSLSLSLPRHRNNISFFHNNIGGVLVVIFATAVGTVVSWYLIMLCAFVLFSLPLSLFPRQHLFPRNPLLCLIQSNCNEQKQSCSNNNNNNNNNK